MKHAVVFPTFKKGPNVNHDDVRSYGPMSNLSTLSKILERFVCSQLVGFLDKNALFPEQQSVYRKNHSTVTAVLKVMSDILLTFDEGRLILLTSLDMSSAFDTVDHATLLSRLYHTFGFDKCVLSWFSSYLSSRSQSVSAHHVMSKSIPITCGVPQGSVLGPILFLLYTANIPAIVTNCGLSIHLYADDVLIYGSCKPAECDLLSKRISDCIDHVSEWLKSNNLLLNEQKTNVMWCSSNRRSHQIPDFPVRIGSVYVNPVSVIKFLGIYVDCHLTMKKHVSNTVSSCFSMLRQIRSIRRCVSRPLLINLISSLVFSRLDYSCSSLIGQTSITFRRLQSVINASARVAYSRRMTDSISPLLRDLHWLKFRFVWTFGCVNWFIVVLMVQLHLISPHSCKKWKMAAYTPHQASSLQSVASRGRLLEVVLFQWPELACGTAYLIMY